MKLTKTQRKLLEQRLVALEGEKKNFWIKSIVMYIVVLAFGHYVLSWNINITFILIWGGIILTIDGWRKSKLDKEVEEITFKLAGK